jgi:signal transduction histidine kinase
MSARLLSLTRLRLWPRTLFGQLVIILGGGMFAGQLLTSTIWFETHDNRMLEIPVRLFASRLADTVRLLSHADNAVAQNAIVDTLGDARYQLRWAQANTPVVPPPLSVAHRVVHDLLTGVIRRRLGVDVPMTLIDVHLHDEARGRQGMLALFDSRMPSGEFHVQMQVPATATLPARWLDVEAREGQAGMLVEPRAFVLDYLVRIYLIRFVAVLVLALIAVRFAVRPLKQLAQAAERLGRNIHRPPLAVSGPLEVRSAAQSLNAMQQQLIDGIGARTRLLAAVSHDLRTPITRLRLRAEMLPDEATRERFRTDLADMEAMVRSTLEFMQGIDVSEPRRAIDIDSLLRGLADDFVEMGAQVSVTGSAVKPIDGYPRNLKRCLQNLVENAVRYGEHVTISIDDREHELQVTVSDDGPGIHGEGLLERVFEPYVRLGARASTENDAAAGSGLGLTIARSVAMAHGGTLVLRNRGAGGLDAVLTLVRDHA